MMTAAPADDDDSGVPPGGLEGGGVDPLGPYADEINLREWYKALAEGVLPFFPALGSRHESDEDAGDPRTDDIDPALKRKLYASLGAGLDAMARIAGRIAPEDTPFTIDTSRFGKDG